MAEAKFKSKFPKRFLWGAATSAYQVDGGIHNQWTVWELENAKVKAAQAEYHFGDYESWNQIKKQAKDPNNYVAGDLADHRKLFTEDFDLLQKMHMNAYRFSVEWSKIEPREGVFNTGEFAYYKKYISELKSRGIEPIMTLFHFTLPVWFAEKGGFEKRSNVKYFTRFVKKLIGEIGSSVKYIIIINEPETYAFSSYYNQDWPPMEQNIVKLWKVINNLAYAHRKTVKIIRLLNKQAKISIAKNSRYFYPGDNALLSRASANLMQYFGDDYIIKKFIRNCDFIGVNYEASDRVYGYRVHNSEDKMSDIQQNMQPADIQYILERLYRKYKLPIMITGNGLADANDENRKWWITQTIIGMQNAIEYGVKLIGYLHWSLMDTFEWSYGKWPKFGLVQVDYKTRERKLRPSAVWFGRIIKKIRGI